MPYISLQTVVELPAYLRAAKACGMTDAEMAGAVDYLARHPEAGDLIVGSGGCRKLRLAGKGKGKSGGYRVITYFARADEPVFLLWVIAKSQAANLSDAQVNTLATAVKTLMPARLEK